MNLKVKAHKEGQETQVPTQRKRPRHEDTSQGTQAFGDEPQWVGKLFDRMSSMERNFNERFDQVDANIVHL